MSGFTFHPEERLKSAITIGRLFKEGSSFSVYPLRVVWLPVPAPGNFPAQFALTVPKRAFPRAVDRNKLRRKIRESYRLQKARFYSQLTAAPKTPVQYAFLIIYIAREPLPYAIIDAAMQRLLKKLAKEIKRK